MQNIPIKTMFDPVINVAIQNLFQSFGEFI